MLRCGTWLGRLAGLMMGIAVAATSASAVELCAILDGSGSISTNDFNLQKAGLAAAIASPSIVPRNSTVTLSVVQFGSNAVLAIPPTMVDSDTTAGNIATAISNIAKDNGSTNMAAAIDLCRTQGLPFAMGQKQVIDLSTDGMPDSGAAALAAADAAIGAGVEAINALGVGSGIDVAFLNTLVRPQPGKAPPQDGFVLVIPNFNAYANAIADKLRAEILGVGPRASAPAVSTTVLGATALCLLLLGVWRERQTKLASA